MLFYFSNVERQGFFPLSYTFRHVFFIRRMEEEHFLGRAFIAFERQRLYLFRQSQEWTSYLQNEHFSSYSQDTSVSFLPSFKKNCEAIQS